MRRFVPSLARRLRRRHGVRRSDRPALSWTEIPWEGSPSLALLQRPGALSLVLIGNSPLILSHALISLLADFQIVSFRFTYPHTPPFRSCSRCLSMLLLVYSPNFGKRFPTNETNFHALLPPCSRT